MNNNNSNNSTAPTQKGVQPNSDNLFVCEVCSLMFSCYRWLQRHQREDRCQRPPCAMVAPLVAAVDTEVVICSQVIIVYVYPQSSVMGIVNRVISYSRFRNQKLSSFNFLQRIDILESKIYF